MPDGLRKQTVDQRFLSIAGACCLLLFTCFVFSCGGPKPKPQYPIIHTTTVKPAPSQPPSPQSEAKPPLPFTNSDVFRADVAEALSQKAETRLSPSPAPMLSASSGAGPDIRIGLDTAALGIRISAPAAFYVQARSESDLRKVKGDIQIRVAQENREVKTEEAEDKPKAAAESSPAYQIQAGSFSRMENAEKIRGEIAGKLDVPVFVYLNSDNGMNQVRIGEFSTREDARDYLPTVRRDYPDAFIVHVETVSAESGGEIVHEPSGANYVRQLLDTIGGKITVALNGSNGLELNSLDGFRIYPASATEFLRVNGKDYRGFFDIFLNKSGRLTLINQLGLEDYLFGVVPAEMNPNSYPEPAALAAQAIAMRTNSIKNIGRYGSDGFDLTDDTPAQVYGGVASENPMANDSVLQTAGIAIYYNGNPIDAMYTSACGGRTEDFGLVYGTNSVPYLQSVLCAFEHGHEHEDGVTLNGTDDAAGTFRAMDGSLATRNIELARVIGLIPLVTSVSADSLASNIGADEAGRLIDTAAAIINSSRRVSAAAAGITEWGGFLHHAADVFFGGDVIHRRISQADENYYIATLTDGAMVPEALRPTIAYLMQRRLLRPTAENSVNVDAPMYRGDAIALLVNWIESERRDIIRRGDYVQVSQQKNEPDASVVLNVGSGGGVREFRPARNLRLFRVDPGQITPVREMKLSGAEKLAFHLNEKNEIDFLEIELSQSGTVRGGVSDAAVWQETLSRSSLTARLRDLIGGIGNLMDIQPYRHGYSGRTVQIQAVGSRGTIVLNGHLVRNALGLRDTLFTMTREFNTDGAVESFIFSGRGFGHGVGMCQTGAYLMAKAGRNYMEILETYYTGVEIKRAY